MNTKKQTDIIDSILAGANVVFIGAHPDDEGLVGPLLAFAADHSAATVVCLTAGESGWQLLERDIPMTLAALRRDEIKKACAVLGASFHVLDYTNGLTKSHPEGLAIADDEKQASVRWEAIDEFTEKPEQVIARWTKEAGDPVPRLAEYVAAAAPCLVVAFDTVDGYGGHPEHVAAGMLAERCVRAFAESDVLGLYQMMPRHLAAPDDTVISAAALAERARPRTGKTRDYLDAGIRADALHECLYGRIGTEREARHNKSLRDAVEEMHFRKP